MQPHLQALPTRCGASGACGAGAHTWNLVPSLGPGAPVCTMGLPPTLWTGMCGLWQWEGGGLQSTDGWTTGRGGERAGKGRGQTFGFSKVKEIYFLRSRHRKWAQPQLCSTLSGARALLTCRWTGKLVVKCPIASISV